MPIGIDLHGCDRMLRVDPAETLEAALAGLTDCR